MINLCVLDHTFFSVFFKKLFEFCFKSFFSSSVEKKISFVKKFLLFSFEMNESQMNKIDLVIYSKKKFQFDMPRRNNFRKGAGPFHIPLQKTKSKKSRNTNERQSIVLLDQHVPIQRRHDVFLHHVRYKSFFALIDR